MSGLQHLDHPQDARAQHRAGPSLLSRATAFRPGREHVPALALAVVMLAYGAWLLWLSRGMYFWSDDYEFLLERGTIDGRNNGLFEPHNGHWSTMIVLIYRAGFAMFGMTTYTPFVLVTILIHLGIASLLYTLVARVGGGRALALLPALFALFIPVGFDNILWDAAMNNTGALLAGFLALLVLHRGDFERRSVGVSWLVLCVGLMFSGTGISSVVIATAFAAARRGPRTAVLVMSVPTAVFATWFLLYGRGANDVTWSATSVPQFVWTGLTKTLGNVVGVPELGPVLFAGLVVAMLTSSSRTTELRHLAWAGTIAAVAQLFLEALTRGIYGPDVATSGRYAYFTIILLTPAVALAVRRTWDLVGDPRWLVVLVGSVLSVGYVLHSLGALNDFAGGWRGVTGDLRGQVLATSQNVAAGQPLLQTELEGINKFIDPRVLGLEQVRAALPDDPVTNADRLRSESEFNVGVRSTTYDMFRPALIDLTSGWKEAEATPGGGCDTYTATRDDPLIQIATQDGTEIGITSDATQLVTVLQRDDELGPIRIWGVEAGPVYIASTARDAVLKVSFNAAGKYTICKQ